MGSPHVPEGLIGQSLTHLLAFFRRRAVLRPALAPSEDHIDRSLPESVLNRHLPPRALLLAFQVPTMLLLASAGPDLLNTDCTATRKTNGYPQHPHFLRYTREICTGCTTYGDWSPLHFFEICGHFKVGVIMLAIVPTCLLDLFVVIACNIHYETNDGMITPCI